MDAPRKMPSPTYFSCITSRAMLRYSTVRLLYLQYHILPTPQSDNQVCSSPSNASITSIKLLSLLSFQRSPLTIPSHFRPIHFSFLVPNAKSLPGLARFFPTTGCRGLPWLAHPCLVFPFVPIFSYFLLAHNVITDCTIYRFFFFLYLMQHKNQWIQREAGYAYPKCRNFAANPGSEKTKNHGGMVVAKAPCGVE